MIEVLTKSGVTIHSHIHDQNTAALVQQAADFLGGIVVVTPLAEGGEIANDTVLNIMEAMAIGTTMNDAQGLEYRLLPAGWFVFKPDGKILGRSQLPPYEHIVKATLPGGWTWERPE